MNGDEILISDVLSLRDSYGEDAVLASDFRDDLTRLIFQAVVTQQLAADFGVTVDQAAIDARVAEFNDAIAATGVSRAEALGVPGATDELLRREAIAFESRLAGLNAVASREEFVAGVVENDPQIITEVCVRHILVPTRGEAEDAARRLGEGEDFSALATELSLDTATPGGDLGCAKASRYVTEFADASMVAPVGAIFGPVETDFGFHILVVDDRTAPTLEEIRADPTTYVSDELAQSLWIEWFNEKIETATVEIASEIGTWSTEALAIVPPAGG